MHGPEQCNAKSRKQYGPPVFCLQTAEQTVGKRKNRECGKHVEKYVGLQEGPCLTAASPPVDCEGQRGEVAILELRVGESVEQCFSAWLLHADRAIVYDVAVVVEMELVPGRLAVSQGDDDCQQ